MVKKSNAISAIDKSKFAKKTEHDKKKIKDIEKKIPEHDKYFTIDGFNDCFSAIHDEEVILAEFVTKCWYC